jgi:beta-lactamase class A
MKLLVAIAVMDAVDRGEWRLADPVVIRKHDLSLAVQPLAKLVTEAGFNTTVDDLVRRAIVDSDRAPPPTSWPLGLAGLGQSNSRSSVTR